jgi:hypothetical protein
MKKASIILVTLLINCITISCSKDSNDIVKTQGTVKLEATTTSGGINIVNYTIKEGSIELINEGPIEISQSQWSKSHTASSGNTVTILGKPDLGETLTIKVFFDNVLIGSGSSINSGVSVIVVAFIP